MKRNRRLAQLLSLLVLLFTAGALSAGSATAAEEFGFITEWGDYGAGDGQFGSHPNITTDPAGNVYAADDTNGRIQKFTADGTFLASWKVKVTSGLATDPAGNVYVAGRSSSPYADSGPRIMKYGLRPVPDPPGSDPPGSNPRAPLAKATITNGTTGKTVMRKASFRFKSDTAGASFRCRLSGKRVAKKLKRWKKCSSPKRYKRLKPGKKTFQVRAVTSAGAGPVAERHFQIVSKPKKPKPKPKPKPQPGPRPESYVVKVDGRYGKIRIRCALAKGCRGSIAIKRGKTPLVKRRTYSLKRGKKVFKLKLTAAGLKALKGKKRVRATGTLIGASGAKVKIIAILKRR